MTHTKHRYQDFNRGLFVQVLEDTGTAYRTTGARYMVEVGEEESSTVHSSRSYSNYHEAFVNFIAEISVLHSCKEKRCIGV